MQSRAKGVKYVENSRTCDAKRPYKISSVKKVDAMNTLVSVFHRTIVPAVVVLTLFTAVANAQSTSIWLEAECASVGSLWNKPADANASNSSYVVIQPGNNSASSAPTNSAGYIDFSFSVSQSGTYRVFARVLTPTANDDSWWVRMDGGSWITWNNIAATSWTWAIHQHIQSERRKPYADVCVS